MSQTAQPTGFKTTLINSGFTGDLVIPGDPDYATSLLRFAKNAQKNAGLVAFVKSAEDVSRVIKFVKAQAAQGTALPVVIRGGGHSTSGASSTEGGIVIDLSRYLKTVQVDADERLGYVGGGATWAVVDAEAIKHGLAMPAGTVNHTGVGGLSLGGGFGWLTGEHGMVLDNIVQVTLVTADGSILTVNESSHSDLFWAIRGSGCNFGCVTEFVYKLHPQRSHVFAGPLIFPPPLLPAVITATQEWYATASEKEGALLIMSNKGPTGGPTIGVLVFYNGDEKEGRQRFAKLISLGPVMNGTGMIPYEALNTLQNDAIPYGANYYFNGTERGEKPVTEQAAQNMFSRLMGITSAAGPCSSISPPAITLLWEFFPLTKVCSVAPDATAFRMRAARPSVPMVISWEGDGVEASKDAKGRLRQAKQMMEEELRHTFPRGREENDTGYGNYEANDPQSTDSSAPLFGGNYPRLQQLKGRYDPDMVFRAWYPIQPAKPLSSGTGGLLARLRRFMDDIINAFKNLFRPMKA